MRTTKYGSNRRIGNNREVIIMKSRKIRKTIHCPNSDHDININKCEKCKHWYKTTADYIDCDFN